MHLLKQLCFPLFFYTFFVFGNNIHENSLSDAAPEDFMKTIGNLFSIDR